MKHEGLHRLAKSGLVLSLCALIWLQHHMIETGSAYYADLARWLFSAPFFAVVITISLTGALSIASIVPSRVGRIVLLLILGIVTPAAIFVTNELYFSNHYGMWLVEGHRRLLFLRLSHYLFVVGLAGCLSTILFMAVDVCRGSTMAGVTPSSSKRTAM